MDNGQEQSITRKETETKRDKRKRGEARFQQIIPFSVQLLDARRRGEAHKEDAW